MKIGMNLFLWSNAVTAELFPLFHKLRAVGYEGVEIPIARANNSNYAAIKRELDNAGLACTTMFNLGADLNPVSPDAGVRGRALDELKWAVDTSRLLSSEALVGPYFAAYAVFSGRGPTRDELDWSADVMRAAAEYAGSLRLGIEYLNRFETYLLNTARETSALVDKVARPNFGILYDTHQAHHEEDDVGAAIRSANRRINHVHFSESQRGTLGTGQVDWVASVRALKAINYHHWIMVESFASDVPPLSGMAHVWRDCFGSKDEVYQKGYRFVRSLWDSVR